MDPAEKFLRTVLDGVPRDAVRGLLTQAVAEGATDGSIDVLQRYLAEQDELAVERAYAEQEKHRMRIDSGRNVCTAGDWSASVEGTDINNGMIEEFQRHVIGVILSAAGGLAPEPFPPREDLVASLREIREVVDRQAEDEGLWSLPLDPQALQPVVEAYLQQELRHLHKVIEDYTSWLA